MKIRYSHLVLAAVLNVASFVATESNAGPITYTIATRGSGSLGDQSFTDAEVLLKFVGDTANVVESEPGVFYNSLGTASVTIAGLGSAVFTEPIAVYSDNPHSSLGFMNGNIYIPSMWTLGVLNLLSPDYGAYDLASAFGPVFGNSFTSFTSAGFATDRGAFIFPPASGDFAAATSVTAVPEPAGLAMLGLGAGVLGCVARRKVRASA